MKKVVTVRKTTRLLKVREILRDFRSEVSDEQILQKHGLRWEQLEKIYSKLFHAGFLSAKEMIRRVELRSGKDVSHIPFAELDDSDRMYECEICGYVGTQHFSMCPRCRQINVRRLSRRSFGSATGG